MGSLKNCLRTLEQRSREPSFKQAPSGSFAEEVRAIDAEIMKIEEEMKALGMDPYRNPDRTWTNSAGHPTLSLDEHIAMLEEEIGRCQED